MIGKRLIISSAAASLLLAGLAPVAFAYAARQTATDTPPVKLKGKTIETTQKKVNLSPIVVNGNRVPFPIALQMVKRALNRPWSSSASKQDTVVCHFEYDTRARGWLACITNREHFKRQDATQLAMTLPYGSIPAEVAEWTQKHPINIGAFQALLDKLPPANSSYNLLVKNHGTPVTAYVVNSGVLVKVIHYKQDGAGQQ